MKVITPGFIVEGIVNEIASGYFVLTIWKILSIVVDEYE